MDSLELTFRLLDRVSPTLEVMDGHLAGTRRSLGDVDKALRDLDRAEKQARFTNERDPLKRYRAGLEMMRDSLGGAKGEAVGLGQAMAMFGGASGLATSVANFATGAFETMAHAAAESALSITRFAIESASFKRDTTMAFELIEGSAKGAAETFDRLSSLADKTPFKTSDVLTFGKVLRSTGFTIRQTEDLLAGMFDVGAVQGKEGPEKVRSLLEGITKIKGRDALNLETLEQVITSGAAAGLNMQSITAAIARGRKTTIAQAGALIHAGQIKGNEGINAILDAIQTTTDKGGPLGKATLEFGRKSLEGQFSTFSSRLESIFYGVDIQPLVDLMGTVNSLLDKDSPTGRRIREFANETLGGMFRAAARWLTPENIETLLDDVVGAAEATSKAIGLADTAIESFAKGFEEAFGKLPGTFDPVNDALNSFDEALGGKDKAEVWREFGQSLGLMVALTTKFGEALLWVNGHLGMFQQLAQNALPQFTAIPLATSALAHIVFPTQVRQPVSIHRDDGRALSEGLALGIADGAPAVNAASAALANNAVKTTADALEVHSPSRRTFRLGINTGEGFAQGIEASDADRAMADLIAFPAPSKGGASESAPQGRGSISITFGDIYVQAGEAPAPERTARQVRRSVQTELLNLFEEMDEAS